MTNTNGDIVRCEHCGSIVSDREIVLDRTMVGAMWKVFKWCKETGRHEFETHDVAHLFSKTQYARFGDNIYFGGIIYKHSKAHYGMNMERAEEFFANKYEVPRSVWKNPVTGETKKTEPITIRDVPKLSQLLDEDGYYVANYRAGSEVTIL